MLLPVHYVFVCSSHVHVCSLMRSTRSHQSVIIIISPLLPCSLLMILSCFEGTRVISLRGLPVTLISSNTFTDKGVVFGTPLTESCIAQIYQLIEYLTKSESSK